MIIIQERLTCSILPKPFVFDLISSQFLQLTHDLETKFLCRPMVLMLVENHENHAPLWYVVLSWNCWSFCPCFYLIFISRNITYAYISSPLSLFLIILIYSCSLFLSLFSLILCNFFKFSRKYQLWAQTSFLTYFSLGVAFISEVDFFSFFISVQICWAHFDHLWLSYHPILIYQYYSSDPPFQGKYIFMTFSWHCGRVYELICLLE